MKSRKVQNNKSHKEKFLRQEGFLSGLTKIGQGGRESQKIDLEQIKKVVVKAVLQTQILGKGGAKVNKDLLKIVPFFQKRLSDSQIGRIGPKSSGSGNP